MKEDKEKQPDQFPSTLKKVASFFSSLYDSLITALAYVSGGILIIMVGMICASVLMRYFLNMPLGWSTEIAEYMLFFITFLGAAWLLRRDGHVKVDLIISKLPPLPQNVLKIWTTILAAFVCFIITYHGTISTIDHFHRGIPVIQALAIPKYLLLWVIPVGSFLLLIQLIRNIVKHVFEFTDLIKGKKLDSGQHM